MLTVVNVRARAVRSAWAAEIRIKVTVGVSSVTTEASVRDAVFAPQSVLELINHSTIRQHKQAMWRFCCSCIDIDHQKGLL